MIEHVVLFKWQDEAMNGDDRQRVIASAHAGLAALKSKIPSIVDLSVGLNFSARSQGFHSGLVVRFHDRAGLEAYAQHPEHTKVVEQLIRPIAASILAVDYEF